MKADRLKADRYYGLRLDSVWVRLSWLLTGWIACAGCDQSVGLRTEYGRIRNEGRSASLNGTRVLAEMFRQRGLTVNRQGTLSPRLNRYQTIVWFPDRHAPPSQSVIDSLETWLSEGYGRTVIYVGRGYEANLSYLEQIRTQVAPPQQEELQRRIAEAIVDRSTRRHELWEKNAATDCAWFSLKEYGPQKSRSLSGVLATGVDAKQCALEFSTILLPPDRDQEPDQRRLLRVNNRPFVFRLKRADSEGQVIIVSNGSFLLNYGLSHPEHRLLADALISECSPDGSVAFLESGPSEIRIQDRVDAHQPWAWISRPPLRYIVPHLLFWGVLFCFAMYPIFGRARRFRVVPPPLTPADANESHRIEQSLHRTNSTTSFRAHVVALGKLLQRSEPPDVATGKIQTYLETYSKDSTNP